MAVIGGSIESISIQGRTMAVAADADASLSLGGKQIEVKANGNGTTRIIATITIPMLTGLKVAIDHDRGDLQFLKKIADAMAMVPVTITFVDGNAYQGKAIVAGEFNMSTQDATAEVALHGQGEFTLQ